jgi:hypothetical protein
MNLTVTRVQRFSMLATILLGVLIAAGTTRLFFAVPPTDIHVNHESNTYIYRLIDFRESLATGHYFPQWSTYMHGGLGGPYFSYYQPGFFYLASAMPHQLPALKAIGLAVALLLFTGFLGMWRLVGARFGSAAGILAGALFVLSTYASTEIWVRGDFAELTAMMLMPLQMGALLWWRGSRNFLSLAALSLATGALVISHAPVAFVTLLLIGAYIFIEDVVIGRSLRNAVLSGLPILGGVLLAAFYWFPIVLEWNLVQPELAFAGLYGYSNHFIGLGELAGQSAASPALVPVALGLPMLLSIALLAVFMLARRQTLSEQQRELVRLLLCLTLGSTLLLLRVSEPLWQLIPLLPKIQFPWRILTLLTLGLSGLGAVWVLGAGKLQSIAVGLLLALLVWSYPNKSLRVESFPLPARPADLAQMNYAPDRENEWVPRGARTFPVLLPQAPGYPPNPYREIATSATDCQADGFERSQSRLVVDIDASPGCVVTLPHYYFPVGWTASLAGREIPIENQEGRMALRFPDGARGNVVLIFGHTPARRAGLWVSFLTLIVLTGLVAWELSQATARARPGSTRRLRN